MKGLDLGCGSLKVEGAVGLDNVSIPGVDIVHDLLDFPSPIEKRRVLLVDGTNVSAPDTPENQAVYPQHANQAEGCGFPMIKLTALFSLSTGAVHSAAAGDLQTSEIALFRDQVHHIKSKELIVYQWTKPISRPKGLDPKSYDELPETMVARIYTITRDGFRTRIVTLVTTLTDPQRYPAEEMARLYAQRWPVEIDFRHLKTTMEMDILSCKSPPMLQKELAVYLLTYNLICALRHMAAQVYNRPALHLSFKGVKTHLCSFMII